MSIMFLTISKSDSELIVVRLSPYLSSMRFSTASISAFFFLLGMAFPIIGTALILCLPELPEAEWEPFSLDTVSAILSASAWSILLDWVLISIPMDWVIFFSSSYWIPSSLMRSLTFFFAIRYTSLISISSSRKTSSSSSSWKFLLKLLLSPLLFLPFSMHSAFLQK